MTGRYQRGGRHSRLFHLYLLGMPLFMVQLRLQPDHLLGLAGPLVRLSALLLPPLLVVVQPVAIAFAVELDVLVLRLWAQRQHGQRARAPAGSAHAGRRRPDGGILASGPTRPPAASPSLPCTAVCIPPPRPPSRVPGSRIPQPRLPPCRQSRGLLRGGKGRPPRKGPRLETLPLCRFGSSRPRGGGQHPPRALRRAWRGQREGEKRNERGRRGAFRCLACQVVAGERNAGGRWGSGGREMQVVFRWLSWRGQGPRGPGLGRVGGLGASSWPGAGAETPQRFVTRRRRRCRFAESHGDHSLAGLVADSVKAPRPSRCPGQQSAPAPSGDVRLARWGSGGELLTLHCETTTKH